MRRSAMGEQQAGDGCLYLITGRATTKPAGSSSCLAKAINEQQTATWYYLGADSESGHVRVYARACIAALVPAYRKSGGR